MNTQNKYSKLTYVKVCSKKGAAWKIKLVLSILSRQRKFKFQNRKIPWSSNLWRGNSSISKGSWSLTNRKLSHSPPKRVPHPSNTLKERYWKASENLPALPSSDELRASATWHKIMIFKKPLIFQSYAPKYLQWILCICFKIIPEPEGRNNWWKCKWNKLVISCLIIEAGNEYMKVHIVSLVLHIL